MKSIHSWRSGTALTLLMTLATSTVLPWSLPATASPQYTVAQRFPDSWRTPIAPAGTAIYTQFDKEKIILKPDETVPVTLTTSRDILSSRGDVIIPAGSEIKGKLRPADDGTQFVAETIKINNSEYDINANSQVINRRETISQRSNPKLLEGAAIGGGAAAVLGQIFGGRINILEVLGGAGVGALASVLLRGNKEVEVIEVYPDSDLTLRLESDFALNSNKYNNENNDRYNGQYNDRYNDRNNDRYNGQYNNRYPNSNQNQYPDRYPNRY